MSDTTRRCRKVRLTNAALWAPQFLTSIFRHATDPTPIMGHPIIVDIHSETPSRPKQVVN